MHEPGHARVHGRHSCAELPRYPDGVQEGVAGSPAPHGNAVDCMSARSLAAKRGRHQDTPSTPAVNRHAAGWIDPAEVALHLTRCREVHAATGSRSGLPVPRDLPGRAPAFTDVAVLDQRHPVRERRSSGEPPPDALGARSSRDEPSEDRGPREPRAQMRVAGVRPRPSTPAVIARGRTGAPPVILCRRFRTPAFVERSTRCRACPRSSRVAGVRTPPFAALRRDPRSSPPAAGCRRPPEPPGLKPGDRPPARGPCRDRLPARDNTSGGRDVPRRLDRGATPAGAALSPPCPPWHDTP